MKREEEDEEDNKRRSSREEEEEVATERILELPVNALLMGPFFILI